ncbi:MAG: saccharopine dehydrogenase NADP-binding domain-containing protein [Bacilli bacterium]|nr:saccharopine dehydrogenase NADP-binding domain-containing protein [Bacilli bacterium]
MIKFDGNIVQFGFGAVGKSFYEKVSKEIKFNENNYYVITRDQWEFEAFINMGGISTNFIICDVNRENYQNVFQQYLGEGDLLIDFADTVGTRDICKWCAVHNIMYINTGEADWPDNWYSIFTENVLKNEMKNVFLNDLRFNKHPIVLQHGNNPGLVSHFVKAALEFVVNTQFKKDKRMKQLLKEAKFNVVAQLLGLRMIHVNDIDLQEIDEKFDSEKLVNTWCVDSFFFEMLSEATQNVGTHEAVDSDAKYNLLDLKNGFLEYKNIASDLRCRTYYPNGYFEGFLVPHEETITIAKSLEVIEGDSVVYRPSVMFLYSPCSIATEYLEKSKVNSYPDLDMNKPLDCESENGPSIVRGHVYPNNSEIVYKEKIKQGTEYVGILLIGENFKPVWVGNRVESSFLFKDKKSSYWQTPTITPVAMSALAALCWMIKNKNKRGIYFPDDISDYKYIIGIAEKYISKTIYKTFESNDIEEWLHIDLKNIQSKDFFVN